jgi:hypothetical protein
MSSFFLDNPCVRLSDIQMGEEHNCFFCGYPIPCFVTESCPVCSLMICPHCGNCMCTISKQDQRALKQIHLKYCCNYKKLKNFKKIKGIKASEDLIDGCTKAIKYCSDKLEQDRKRKDESK